MHNKSDLPEDLRSSPPVHEPEILENFPGPSGLSQSHADATTSTPPDPINQQGEADSLFDPLDDLPRMPDTSSEEENEDDEEINAPDQEIEEIHNNPRRPQIPVEIPDQPLHLHREFHIEDPQTNRRGLGRAVKGNSYFMQGLYIILPVQPGENDICALCNSYAPLDENKSEILSYELEKRIFRNGVLESRGSGFGISFDRQGGLAQWQIVCRSCLSYEGEEQDVIDSVYRIKFHVDNGNLKSDADLHNVFHNAPELAIDVIRDIRNDWIQLNRAYSLDMRYYQLKLTRKFYFSNDESKIFLGLDADEMSHIYINYLRPFASRYEVFDVKEIFACLMLMLRSGKPLSWVHRMIVKYTDQNININSLSKSIRKTLYFLGKSDFTYYL